MTAAVERERTLADLTYAEVEAHAPAIARWGIRRRFTDPDAATIIAALGLDVASDDGEPDPDSAGAILRLALAGVTGPEIAARLGVSKSRVARVRRAGGLVRRGVVR